MAEIQDITRQLLENVEKVIVGKTDTIRLTITGLLCQGHILIEDVPGTGKTMLAKSIARSIGGAFSRIQFTPDMLPSDVTGVSMFNQKTNEFEFRQGPIVAQIVLTDEINRATPKTQAALLEAMEEHQVTVDGKTYPLPEPFLVLATQNPIEYEGTFPLPEAQMDRFLLRISLGYPARNDEVRNAVESTASSPNRGSGAGYRNSRIVKGAGGCEARNGYRRDQALHCGFGRNDASARGNISRRKPAREPGIVPHLTGTGSDPWQRICPAG